GGPARDREDELTGAAGIGDRLRDLGDGRRLRDPQPQCGVHLRLRAFVQDGRRRGARRPLRRRAGVAVAAAIDWRTPMDQQTAETGTQAGADLHARVEKVLDQIRPYVQQDGGDLELIDIVDGIVQIRLAGSCVGCMYSMMTLQAGVERMLKEQVPEIKAVEAAPF